MEDFLWANCNIKFHLVEWFSLHVNAPRVRVGRYEEKGMLTPIKIVRERITVSSTSSNTGLDVAILNFYKNFH
jgi:hypothetical protein